MELREGRGKNVSKILAPAASLREGTEGNLTLAIARVKRWSGKTPGGGAEEGR